MSPLRNTLTPKAPRASKAPGNTPPTLETLETDPACSIDPGGGASSTSTPASTQPGAPDASDASETRQIPSATDKTFTPGPPATDKPTFYEFFTIDKTAADNAKNAVNVTRAS